MCIIAGTRRRRAPAERILPSKHGLKEVAHIVTAAWSSKASHLRVTKHPPLSPLNGAHTQTQKKSAKQQKLCRNYF